MSKTITANANARLSASVQSTGDLNTVFAGNPAVQSGKNYASTDVSTLWFKTYAVGTTPTSIDLSTVTDPLTGTAQPFTQVVALQVINNDATNTVTVGSAVTNSLFGPMPKLGPGGCVYLTTSLVVDGTHKIIELVSTGAATSVDLIIVGN